MTRRSVVPALLSACTLVAVLLAPTPALASVPEGFSDPETQDPLQVLLILGGIPLALFAVIVLAIYLPAIMRGERVGAGGHETESQWFGGPRKGTAELAGPDTPESQAGGGSARW